MRLRAAQEKFYARWCRVESVSYGVSLVGTRGLCLDQRESGVDVITGA
jgi:hypothetical protein